MLEKHESEIVGTFCYMYSRFERFLLDHECGEPRGNVLGISFEKFKENTIFKTIETDDLNELRKPLYRYEWIEAKSVEEWVQAQPSGLDGLLVWRKIRQVRHNIFHGSKALEDKERDFALIKESLEVLRRFAKLEYEFSEYV